MIFTMDEHTYRCLCSGSCAFFQRNFTFNYCNYTPHGQAIMPSRYRVWASNIPAPKGLLYLPYTTAGAPMALNIVGRSIY